MHENITMKPIVIYDWYMLIKTKENTITPNTDVQLGQEKLQSHAGEKNVTIHWKRSLISMPSLELPNLVYKFS